MNSNKARLMLKNENPDHYQYSTSIHLNINHTQSAVLSVFVNTDSIIGRVGSPKSLMCETYYMQTTIAYLYMYSNASVYVSIIVYVT